MKNNVFRLLALLLALVMCVSLLIACSDPQNPNDDTDDPGTSDPGTDDPKCDGNHVDANKDGKCDSCGAKVDSEEDPKCDGNHIDEDNDSLCDNCGTELKPAKVEIDHSVPEGTNFADEVKNIVNVLHYTTGDHEAYNPWDEICPSTGMEVSPGDYVGDMIFDRTAWLEENYGIVMGCEYIPHGDQFINAVRTEWQTGSRDYQMVDYFAFGAQKVMGQEYFLNMADIEYIDFEDPWWIDSAIEAFRLGDYVEFGASDMLLLDKGATTLVYFNLGMAEDLGIEDLYDLARNNEWTLDVLAECAELALEDNGDDVWDHNDIYGISNGDDPVHNLYIGSGNNFIKTDEYGEFYYSYCTDDGTADVMIDILEKVMYADWYWNSWIKRDLGPENQPKFDNGQALFSFGKAKNCLTMKDMEADYGILPIPMYDEEQGRYYSQVSNYHDSLFAIPMSATGNTEIIGAAIELLSHYSYYNIYDNFFEIIIQNRGARDAESKEMLDIIFDTRTYDMGLLYDPVGISDRVLRYTNTGETGVISFWEGYSNQLEDAITKLNELMYEYNG